MLAGVLIALSLNAVVAAAQNVSVSSLNITDCSQAQTAQVTVDDATGAFAFDFTVAFDCSMLAAEPLTDGDCSGATGAIRAGSLVSDCSLCGANLEDGTVRVGIACTQARSGGGTLLEIDLTPWANGSSTIALSGCAIDETACASTTNGAAQVTCSGRDATLSGTVAPQGRPEAPDPSWGLPVSVAIVAASGSGAALRCARTTDNSGAFGFTGLAPGSYRACLKRSHTLQTCADINLASGANPIDFGVLREGDVTGDNCVVLLDFSALASSFGLCQAEAGYDERADLDMDGCVDLVDFSLLASNFATCGDELTGASTAAE
jgi:hypothetical protein